MLTIGLKRALYPSQSSSRNPGLLIEGNIQPLFPLPFFLMDTRCVVSYRTKDSGPL
jgi:hypothetical protein